MYGSISENYMKFKKMYTFLRAYRADAIVVLLLFFVDSNSHTNS